MTTSNDPQSDPATPLAADSAPDAVPPETAAERPAAAPAQPTAADSAEHWRQLTAQVGLEVAEPLSAALERVIQLATTGRIDREGLRALRSEIEGARRIGIVSQQLARLGAKRLRQSDERLNLAQTLQAVLTQRAREVSARGIDVRQSIKPIEVLADPALLFSLLNGLLDWAVELGGRRIAFRVEQKEWPRYGRVSCEVADAPEDRAGTQTLSGYLVQQIADDMQLGSHTVREAGRTAWTLEFPRTVGAEQPPVSTLELDHGDASSLNSKPLAGSQVLVLASRREVRQQIRQSIANMGLVIDFVGSVDEAISFCSDGLPHALIFEGVLRGQRLMQLAAEIRAELPNFVVIEIIEEGAAFEVSGLNGLEHARVGREGLHHALPSTLVFELSKQM